MDLKEFVEETLTDIFLGVAGAQKRITDIGGEINPAVKNKTQYLRFFYRAPFVAD